MTKDELAALRAAMEAAHRTVEQMVWADTSRWTTEQRVEMDLAYMRAKNDADEAMRAYYDALAFQSVAQAVAGRVSH